MNSPYNTNPRVLESLIDAYTNGVDIGIDTNDATAVAADILVGKTAYVNGVKVTGSIASQEAKTITPTTAAQTIEAGKYLTGAITVSGDANLLAENIKSGVTIFGVAGTYTGETV